MMNTTIRPRLKEGAKMAHLKITRDENRVLVIGDVHEPFTLDGYLEFCVNTYYEYNCNTVVFIGDIIDNHYASYHETDSDALGGKDELELAIKKIERWHDAFPEAIVLFGNHDLIISRKAQSGSIPTPWLKSFEEVLHTPNWNFVNDVTIDDVLYTHGIGSKAHIKVTKDMQSCVQGHHHTDCYVQWKVGRKAKVFGMQVGCGIDVKSYAMAYGRHFSKPAIGCGVIIDGKEAINVLMDL